jgi:Domain of unknown function (DUF202)
LSTDKRDADHSQQHLANERTFLSWLRTEASGDYHVKGEITNIGKSMLNFVKVTVHFYDANGQLISDSSCCYTDPT